MTDETEPLYHAIRRTHEDGTFAVWETFTARDDYKLPDGERERLTGYGKTLGLAVTALEEQMGESIDPDEVDVNETDPRWTPEGRAFHEAWDRARKRSDLMREYFPKIPWGKREMDFALVLRLLDDPENDALEVRLYKRDFGGGQSRYEAVLRGPEEIFVVGNAEKLGFLADDIGRQIGLEVDEHNLFEAADAHASRVKLLGVYYEVPAHSEGG